MILQGHSLSTQGVTLRRIKKNMSKEKFISTIAIIYFMVGFIFSIAFATYYHWPFLSFLSPGFYSVILTWPLQTIGFARDLWTYGLAGKPI